MKIKINAKSDSCNCQGTAGSGCTNKRKSEAPIDKRYAFAGMFLLILAAIMFVFPSFLPNDASNLLPSHWFNWAQAAEVFGILFFGAAMARWRG